MSYCVNFITQKQVSPDQIFQKLADNGEKIMVISDEFPCVKFGVIDESLRGIEVNKEDDGYEIRICTCSSRADYSLFIKTVVIMQELTGELGYTENEERIESPHEMFNEEWLENEFYSAYRLLRILVKHADSAIVMQGMFESFCVGPKMLIDNDISLYLSSDDDKDKWERLICYLTIIQWKLADLKSTHSQLALCDSKGDKHAMSIIYIKDNQVLDFDYISYAPLMGFVNLDTDDFLVIRFKDLHKAIKITEYKTSFSKFDEYQLIVCPKENSSRIISMEEINEIIATAKRYELKEISIGDNFPGDDYDEHQNTFIFTWDAENSDITLDEYVESIQNFHIGHFERKIYEWKEAKMGDKFYVVKVGDGKLGIVMAGVLGSHPYISPDWNGRGRKPYKVELKPSLMLNPDNVPMLSTEVLEENIPDFMWRGGYSGRLLENRQAKVLEKLYATYLKSLEGLDDGINISFRETMK